MNTIHLFDRIMEDFFEEGQGHCRQSMSIPQYPVNNVYLNEERAVVLEFALAGFDKKDIEVAVENSTIKIKGINNQHDLDKEAKWRYISHKIAKRNFEVHFKIPSEYNLEKTEVEFKNGLLHIMIPLKPELKPVTKQLEIK